MEAYDIDINQLLSNIKMFKILRFEGLIYEKQYEILSYYQQRIVSVECPLRVG